MRVSLESINTICGLYLPTASTTSVPSPTDATTSSSARMPSRSSRASRKTWLSSTRRIRIGRPMAVRTLLGGEKQVVVGLAALLHLDLDVRVRCADPLEERLERPLRLAPQQRPEAARGAAHHPADAA